MRKAMKKFIVMFLVVSVPFSEGEVKYGYT